MEVIKVLTLVFGGISIIFNLYVVTSDIRMSRWRKEWKEKHHLEDI